MASAWTTTRTTKSGGRRFRVEFRLGGREAPTRYGGSFTTKREADERKRWLAGELAGRRVPDLTAFELAARPVMLAEACGSWRATRVDVTAATRVLHQVALNRALRVLGERPVDAITVDDVNRMVAELSITGSRRETIRKTVKYLAAVLEDAGRDPNPARDRKIRLPYEEHVELVPPTAEHVEAVVRLLPSGYRLPLLWFDWSGARVASVGTLLVGDYDEPQRRVHLPAASTKVSHGGCHLIRYG